MRVNIPFEDRVGIAHEILAVLARQGLNVQAVEVDPPNIYIDIPELKQTMLPALCRRIAIKCLVLARLKSSIFCRACVVV